MRGSLLLHTPDRTKSKNNRNTFLGIKVMLRLFLVLALLSPGLALSSELADARLSLKKWGLAYCLSTYQKGDDSKLDAGGAMDGYFQLGSHNEEMAYANVRKFFDKVIKTDQSVSHLTGQPLVLMKCLNAYESPSYKKMISSQDKFLK